MEKAMAPHSITLAWKIPWMEEPGGLQSMGSLRVGHNWATSLSLFTFMHWRRKWQPTPAFLPGESQGRGSLVGCRLWGRAQLKRLGSSSSSSGCRIGQLSYKYFSPTVVLVFIYFLKISLVCSQEGVFQQLWLCTAFILCWSLGHYLINPFPNFESFFMTSPWLFPLCLKLFLN